MLLLLASLVALNTATQKPNVIFIMADDLGYGDVGFNGQKLIQTPNLDKMAREGLVFRQYYTAAPVCAPARCSFITGMHTGHAYVRDNSEIQPEGQMPLKPGTQTIAKQMKAAGYTTAMIGKWGLGGPGSTGEPNKQGWDYWFGYLCQRQAHSYYPDHLWRNGERVELDKKTYSHDLMASDALEFVRKHRNGPFFLYLPFTIPHVALQVPEDGLARYRGHLGDDPAYDGKRGYRPHPAPHAAYAAMVSRLDRDVGRLLALLRELKLDRRTLVIFTSDNGPPEGRTGGADPIFFGSARPFGGWKGGLYDGGIHMPFVAWWPGTVRKGTTNHLTALYDMFPTFVELAGGRGAKGDGVSFARELLGKKDQVAHDHLYWETAGYGEWQATRFGRWKAVRKGSKTIEVYDLATDIGEKRNVAAQHPEVVRRAEVIFAKAHAPSKEFPLKMLGEGGE